MALCPRWPRWAGSRRNIHSLTPCLCGHYTTSVIDFLHFSTVCSIFLAYLSDLTIFFFDLTPSFLWPASRSYTFHFKIHAFFTQSFLSFLKTFPYHLNLCHCISVIISSIPSLSFNSLLENLSVNMAPHIHLIIFISARSTRSLSSLAMFHCHVTCDYAHNFCII